MDTDSVIYPLTSAQEATPISFSSLNGKGIRIQGSFVSARHSINNLLQFAADKNIHPQVVQFLLTKAGIEEAMQTLRDGRMRYRGVLVRS